MLKTPILSLAILITVQYAAVCALMYAAQRSFIYHPPPSVDAPHFMLEVPDARLKIVHRPAPASQPKALIYFGGNAENVAGSLDLLAQAYPERSLYLMNYRGYGGSTGEPSEAGLSADALALYDRVRADQLAQQPLPSASVKNLVPTGKQGQDANSMAQASMTRTAPSDTSEVLVMGVSLGSGVAVKLASVRPVSRLVLVTPYDSMTNVAAKAMPYLPVRWLIKDTFESWRHAPLVKSPTTIVIAENDTVIMPEHAQALATHFKPGLAHVVRLSGVGHNTITSSPSYLPAIADEK